MKLPCILILNILFFLILSSCKKDEIEEITSPVFAGVYNDSMLFHEINPPLQIKLETDTLQNIQYGIDSIDIDLNGSFDIFISQRIYLDWTDNFNKAYLEEYNYPFTRLIFRNGLEVATKRHKVSMPHDNSHVEIWVDTLSFSYPIYNKMDWSGANSFYNMWCITSSMYQGTYGTWFYIKDEERFIGIRMKMQSEYKYGWVKINQKSRENLEILSYAIEN
jgi:hypothetical protein